MLTDIALKKMKPKDKIFKVTDRDGMYALVATSGLITFRYDYRFNGRRETLTIGKYAPGAGGVSLSEARAKCAEARDLLKGGQSPAIKKQTEKRRIFDADRFGEVGLRYFKEARMAESTRSMRRAIYDRDIHPEWKNRLLSEIGPADLRDLCARVKERGAPATAIHVRDIVKQIFGFAILHGEKVANPADEVGPASIAQFEVRDRALSPSEIRIMLTLLERIATLPTIRLGLKLILLTMVRKSELQDGVWSEVEFENAVWSITKERMKRKKPHNVYLSRQAMDIMIALRTCSGNS
ncbi:MAG: integrase arm-type DNA-binding domain-containing protein, partial [Pseudomonadota bacterium]